MTVIKRKTPVVLIGDNAKNFLECKRKNEKKAERFLKNKLIKEK